MVCDMCQAHIETGRQVCGYPCILLLFSVLCGERIGSATPCLAAACTASVALWRGGAVAPERENERSRDIRAFLLISFIC